MKFKKVTLFLQFVSINKMSSVTEKTIDIDELIRSKMGHKEKYVPSFVINWLKHVVHQDEVNKFLWESRHKIGVDWLEECVHYLDMTLIIEGEENLPNKDDNHLYTFVSNHPLGGEDGVALGAILGRHYEGKVKYLVNDLLMNLPGLAPLCIPVNKTGTQAKQFPAVVEACFKSDNHIIMFPAGLCSRRQNGIIRDLPWKKTFITKSVETHRDVIPIHFSGHNSNFFYNLANAGKILGLKMNIAMLYLVDEMYKNVHKEFRITIGKPIPWQKFDKSKTPMEWAKYVQNQVYDLKK